VGFKKFGSSRINLIIFIKINQIINRRCHFLLTQLDLSINVFILKFCNFIKLQKKTSKLNKNLAELNLA